MKKYIFQIIWLVLFVTLFWYFFWEEYWNFHDEREEYRVYEDKVLEEKEDFSTESITQVWEELELFYTPYLWLLDSLVDEINNAQQRVYLEAYIFTETRLRDAIIAAHARWIDVKVLLENNPYKAPYLNDKHFNALSEAWVDVKWSDPLNYSLNHSKLLIIDQKAYVSTGNFSYSLFKHNRDFIVSIEDTELFDVLKNLFLRDFEHKKWWEIHPNLVLSPDNSRAKLTKLIHESEESIDFYFPYIADEDFESELFKAQEKWVKIRWIVGKDFYEENKEIIDRFTSKGIQIYPLIKEKLHGKAMLFDDEVLYIWSINFSRYSFDKNREIWVLLREKNILSKFQKIFNSDL